MGYTLETREQQNNLANLAKFYRRQAYTLMSQGKTLRARIALNSAAHAEKLMLALSFDTTPTHRSKGE